MDYSNMSIGRGASDTGESGMPPPEARIVVAGTTRLSDWAGARASRPHWRLYWNPEPGAEVRFEETIVRLDASVLLLIPPDTPVKQKLRRPCRTCFLHFSLGWPYDRVRGQIFVLPADERPGPTPRQAFALDEPPAWNSRSRFLAQALIFATAARLPESAWPSPPRDKRVAAALAALHQDPAAGRGNASLAEAAGMSVNAFLRLFREAVGIPPQTYLQDLRLRRAARLLRQTDWTVDRIAAASGFRDRNYFTRRFSRRYGCGPAAFRSSPRP